MNFVLRMDMLSFEALHAGVTRRQAEDLLTQFSLIRVATFGDKDSTKKFVKPLQKAAETDLKPDDANDVAAFLAKFGGGI